MAIDFGHRGLSKVKKTQVKRMESMKPSTTDNIENKTQDPSIEALKHKGVQTIGNTYEHHYSYLEEVAQWERSIPIKFQDIFTPPTLPYYENPIFSKSIPSSDL